MCNRQGLARPDATRGCNIVAVVASIAMAAEKFAQEEETESWLALNASEGKEPKQQLSCLHKFRPTDKLSPWQWRLVVYCVSF